MADHAPLEHPDPRLGGGQRVTAGPGHDLARPSAARAHSQPLAPLRGRLQEARRDKAGSVALAAAAAGWRRMSSSESANRRSASDSRR